MCYLYYIYLWTLVYCMNCWFALPSVTVGGKEEGIGWQPISTTSLQQSFHLWQYWSQKHPLFEQVFERDHTQHPE